jgi:hypothetical protein
MCRSLLVVEEELNVFRLSRLSVKEYLENSKPVEYGEVSIHTTAAETCLSFLDISKSRFDKDEARLKGFYRYAAPYWPLHFRKAAENRQIAPLRALFATFALAPKLAFHLRNGLVSCGRYQCIFPVCLQRDTHTSTGES